MSSSRPGANREALLAAIEDLFTRAADEPTPDTIQDTPRARSLRKRLSAWLATFASKGRDEPAPAASSPALAPWTIHAADLSAVTPAEFVASAKLAGYPDARVEKGGDFMGLHTSCQRR